jgi:hypothetical protein
MVPYVDTQVLYRGVQWQLMSGAVLLGRAACPPVHKQALVPMLAVRHAMKVATSQLGLLCVLG